MRNVAKREIEAHQVLSLAHGVSREESPRTARVSLRCWLDTDVGVGTGTSAIGRLAVEHADRARNQE